MKKAFKYGIESFQFFLPPIQLNIYIMVSRLTDLLLRILFQEIAVKIPSYELFSRNLLPVGNILSCKNIFF